MFSMFDSIDNDNLLQKFLLTKISGISFAVKIEYIKEIIPLMEILPVRNAQSNILGLLNLRGDSIPVYDISNIFSKESREFSENQKLLILTINQTKLALIIDSVGEIVEIQEENISHLKYTTDINFLCTTILNNENVLIIEANSFLNYLQNSSKENYTETIQIKNPLISQKIKERTALINTQNSYTLVTDNFINETFIVFKLANETYAFNSNYVKKIKKITKNSLTQIPCVPDFVIGIINFRGDYISLLDIKSFLNLEKSQLPEKMETIILKINGLKIAILVDSVIDIAHLPIANLTQENSLSDSFIIGELLYNEKVINMLNVEKLFSNENVNIENYE